MESTIDIISVGGTTNTVVIGQGSVRHYELMSSDYVRLVFSTDKKINIRIGDHIATKEWGTFYITKLQRPTYNKPTGGFDYDLQFDAPYYLWNNRLYKYDPKNNRNEASWSLTDNLKNHMAVFLRSLSYYGWTYTVDSASYSLEEAQRTVYISFQNKYLLDALSQIAESFNLEYWITDNIIHFGKAGSGTPIDFKLGDNVEEMSAENSESDGANRFYAFGSTQNIPSGYRSSESEVILNGVVQNRLMLPKDTPYIDLDSGLKAEEVVDGIVTFDDVYPRTKSSVSEVVKVSKTVEKSNTVEATTDTSAVADDSTAETEVVNIYRFKTSDFNFSADYILANTSLQVQFVSGKLSGMTFEVAFNPNGENEKTIVDGKTVVNPDSQLFELVRNDTYGLTLPNDTLCPAVGDKFVLLGWDANKLTAWKELITKAEEELKSKLEAYVAKKRIDPLTYVCTMMSDYMYGLDANGKQDPNFSKVGSFPIGQAIRLHSDVYFKDGMRESRVIGYEYKLDLPFDAAQIYVGESPIYSNSKATQNAINEATSTIINYRGGNYSNEGTGSGNLFVISSADTITAPSDNNVFSAKRSDLDFAHKRKDDRISALWTFSHGHGAKRGVQSQDYDNKVNEDNLFGHGFELVEKTNSQGNTVSRLEIDELLVRTKAFFAELEVRKIAYVGGNYLFSSAGSKVYHVEWLLSDGTVLDKATHTADEAYTFRCYMYSDDGTTATMNGFAADDQVMCRTFNIDSGVHINVSNKYWWRRCVGVGKGKIAGSDDDKEYQYVDISKDDCLENSDYPEAEDVIVQFGNWTDKARQGAIFLMVYGDLAPAILEWENVGADGKHFVLPDPTIQISPKGNIFYGEFHSVAEKTGGNSGSIDDQINALIEQLNDIKNQADKKFEMWFLEGTPHPLKGEDYSTANSPASDWSTDAERNLHLQDLYYDTEKDPASDGGRAWRWQSATANNATSWYWEEVADKDTIEALEKARDLQNQVDDISSDSVLSAGSEKTRLLIEWYSAIANYKKYWEQAEDYGLTNDENTSCDSLHEAFFALAKMLNDGEDYSETDCKKETVPSWIDKDFAVDTYLSGYVTNSNTQGVTISSYSKEQYKANWKEFYNQLAAVLKDIKDAAAAATQKAQDTADGAVKSIEEICNDNILDASEKQTLKRDFVAFWHEMYDSDGLEDKGKDENGSFYTSSIASAFDDIVTSFEAVGTFLNASSKWSSPSALSNEVMPVWLNDENITKASPAIDGKSFVSLWSDMYAKRTAYLTLLSKYAKQTADAAQDAADKAQDTADKKVQTFISRTVPETPYDSGDIWVNTADNNNLLISMQSRLTETGTTYPNDWFDLSTIYDKYDPRMILASMADEVWEISGGFVASNGKICVFLGYSSSISGNEEGDILFSTDGKVMKWTSSSSWSEINNSTYVDVFASVYSVLGNKTITIYSTTATGASTYDLCLKQISWTDHFDGKTYTGNVGIMMYNEKGVWETLRTCVQAILENLGDHINAVVYGANGSSGIIARLDTVEQFSKRLTFDSDGNVTNVSKAGVVTTTNFDDWKKNTYDADMTAVNDGLSNKVEIDSFASLMASNADSAGIAKTASLSAYVAKVKRDDGTYSLESDIVLSADKINFIGKTIINDKFWVDANGVVYMEEANVSGTINATSGKIGNFKINGGYLGLTDGLSNTSNDGMWLTDDEIGFNNNGRQVVVGPFSSVGYDYLGWFNDNDSNSLMSKTGVVIDVSGSIDKNIAIKLQGGCISGLAIHTQSLGLEEITQSSFQQTYNGAQTNLDKIPVYDSLTKYINAVLVNTQFSYRAKATDDYTTYSRDRYITLPEMTDADDGHVLMIKKGKGGNSAYVCPGKYKKLVSSSSGYSVSYYTETNDTFMLVDRLQYIADANLKLDSESDAMTFVFFKSLQYTVYDKKYSGGSKTFKGCWVQWKNPRDW